MPTQVTDKLAYYYKDGQLYRVGGGGEAGSLFMSFDIADATEETVDNIPGYTWDITADQFTALCDPATQSVVVDILIPQTEEISQHYVFRRDSAVLAGALGGAFFFAVDTSSATTDIVGTAMRLRVYRNVTWTKLRLEALGEIMAGDAVTAALEGKADKATTYTKTEVDSALSAKANASDVYTKSQTYTKTEEDTLLGAKADASGVYTKSQVDSALSGKVDTVTGKGLSANDFTDAYKDDVDANTSARHTHSNKAILDATTASYTAAEQTKLGGIEAGAQVNTVSKVNNKTGDVTITKGDLDLENVENKSTATIKSEFTGSVATDNAGFVTGGAVKTYVDTAINNLPEPMVFKGTLGTGGTITSLPAAAAANEGFTYKVITAGTYASQAAKVGDVFISDGSAWALVPAGDDVEDTWREVKVNGTSLLGAGISTGAVNFKSGTNVTVSGSGNDITISSTDTDTGATSVTVSGSGNAVSAASYDASTRKITLTKGVTALTSHQSIKTLDTTATTAQSTNANEAIAGSGKVTLHKVAKTGTYSDLIGTPSVNNGILTIQKNGTDVQTFTANQSTNVTANITVPTTVGDLTNDRFVRYDTASQGLSSTQKSNAKTNLELNNVVNTGDSATPTQNGTTKFTTGGAYTLKTSIDSHIANKANPHSVTKAQVGLGNVVNTSDSGTPASGGTQKFTTGGAYAMKEELKASINKINDVLFAGSIDTNNYELADFIKWVNLQENPVDGAIYTMYDSNHEFCVWKGISLDGGRTVVALRTTMTSGGAESTPDLHLVSIINIDETTGECTFEDAEMASVASVQAVDAKASKVVIGGSQYTASFSGGVLSFNS